MATGVRESSFWPQSISLELDHAVRRQLLIDWNNTAHEFRRTRCVHELFAEQAARTPNAVVVAVGDERLKYAEVNRRANQLANYLVS